MKVAINSKLISGPYGGGMQFVTYLKGFLENQGHQIVFDLGSDNIDLILHISPFPYLFGNAGFSLFDANLYQLKHPKCRIVSRINECDERKGTNYINRLYSLASQFSDLTIYISSWLENLYLKSFPYLTDIPHQVILNGADPGIFYPATKKIKLGKLKIVTHHWSNHKLKGHHVYLLLDKLLGDRHFSERFEFTYIGNVPKDTEFKNTRILKPLTGAALADELRKNHVYITASLNEPAGMHHIEGAMCGLPVLYVNSGAIPEYAAEFGLAISEETLSESMEIVRSDYPRFRKKVLTYPYTAKRMADNYLSAFVSLLNAPRRKSPYPVVLQRIYLIAIRTVITAVCLSIDISASIKKIFGK